MRRHACLAVLVACVPALCWAAAASPGTPRWHGSVTRIGPKLGAYMTGRSWHEGCPVGLGELRLVTTSYLGFDGRVRTGHVVVNADVARSVLSVFHRLYDARFPIRRLRPVDEYGASDFRSIEADNTSAFNCRYVDGTNRWSEHAYGRAIDVNPIENPYVSGGSTSHGASVRYLDRSAHRAGMAYDGGTLVEAFRSIGWGWGGWWSGAKDYQHFSQSAVSAAGRADAHRLDSFRAGLPRSRLGEHDPPAACGRRRGGRRDGKIYWRRLKRLVGFKKTPDDAP